MKNVFERQQKVEHRHIDALGHVNNVVYLQWAQDIANEHWNKLKRDIDTKAFVWVVLRHEIDYVGQAKLDNNLTLQTWVGETAGIKSIRHIRILHNEAPIVNIKTTWCLLDAKTMRPKRITEDIYNLLLDKKQ